MQPHWKYLYYHGIKLTLRFHKFITCSCLHWLFMRGFIQGEIHNCTVFTSKEPLMVRVGFFAYLLMANAWKCVADRKAGKKYSFCLRGVALANVMFAYFEIKNQYTITYQERIFHSICCKKVMDFLISSWLAMEWEGMGLLAGHFGNVLLGHGKQIPLCFWELGHSLSWCPLFPFSAHIRTACSCCTLCIR